MLFGVGTLPQAPFFGEKTRFGPGTLPQAPFPNNFLHFPGPLPILGQLSYGGFDFVMARVPGEGGGGI